MIEIVLLIPSRGANSGELFAGSRSSEQRIKGERVRRRVAEITIDVHRWGGEREEVNQEVVDGCSAIGGVEEERITAEAEIVISPEAAGFGYQRPRPRSVYDIDVIRYEEPRMHQYHYPHLPRIFSAKYDLHILHILTAELILKNRKIGSIAYFRREHILN